MLAAVGPGFCRNVGAWVQTCCFQQASGCLLKPYCTAELALYSIRWKVLKVLSLKSLCFYKLPVQGSVSVLVGSAH